MFIVCFVNT